MLARVGVANAGAETEPQPQAGHTSNEQSVVAATAVRPETEHGRTDQRGNQRRQCRQAQSHPRRPILAFDSGLGHIVWVFDARVVAECARVPSRAGLGCTWAVAGWTQHRRRMTAVVAPAATSIGHPLTFTMSRFKARPVPARPWRKTSVITRRQTAWSSSRGQNLTTSRAGELPTVRPTSAYPIQRVSPLGRLRRRSG